MQFVCRPFEHHVNTEFIFTFCLISNLDMFALTQKAKSYVLSAKAHSSYNACTVVCNINHLSSSLNRAWRIFYTLYTFILHSHFTLALCSCCWLLLFDFIAQVNRHDESHTADVDFESCCCSADIWNELSICHFHSCRIIYSLFV